MGGGRRVAPYCRCPHPLDLSHGAARQARVWHRNRCWLDHGPVGGSSSFSHRLSCWFSSQQFGGQLELVRRLDHLDRPRSASKAKRKPSASQAQAKRKQSASKAQAKRKQSASQAQAKHKPSASKAQRSSMLMGPSHSLPSHSLQTIVKKPPFK